MNSKNNFISYTLTNIMYIYEKINRAKKDDVNIKTPKNENCLNQFHCGIC